MPSPPWGLYEECRPDRLQEIVAARPVAYVPLGLLEHHGWQLPVGFDGIKAHRLCRRFAQRTGGLVLPVIWAGGGGGHGPFKWTVYNPHEVSLAVLETLLRRLYACGLRCFVLLAGHYPWKAQTGELVPRLEQEWPDATFIAGTEADIGAEECRLRGDHASRWETAYGLALLPELVDLDAMTPGRDEATAWPAEGPVREDERSPKGCYDAADPRFAQFGEDARTADVQEAQEMLARLEDWMARRVGQALQR